MAATAQPRLSPPPHRPPHRRGAASTGLLLALASVPGRRLLWATWPAIVLAAAGGAAAGFDQRLQPPAYAYLATPAAVAALSAWAAVAVAVVLAYVRAASSGMGADGPWLHLRGRGCSLGQTAVVVAVAVLPCWALAAAAGVAVAPLAFAQAAALRLPHPQVAGPTAALWTWVGAVLAAAAASAGALAAALRPPMHHRLRAAAHRAWVGQLPLDLALIAGGWWASRHAGLDAAAGSPMALFGGSSGTPAPLPVWAAGAAGALFLVGAAMLAGRLLSWGFRIVDRLSGRTLAPIGLIAVRAGARAASPLRLAILPALAAGAVAYMLSGTAGALRTDAQLRALNLGADIGIDEKWPSPCDLCKLPRGVVADPWTFPVGLPGVTSATALISTDDGVRLARGSATATTVGIDAPAALQTVDWSAASGDRALDQLLARDPSAAVISQDLARVTGLRPGERLMSNLLPNQYVAAVVDGWPGVGAGDRRWIVVSWNALGPALRAKDAYNGYGLQVRVLADGGAGVPSAALRDALLQRAAQDVLSRVLPGVDGEVVAAAVAGGTEKDLIDATFKDQPQQAAEVYTDFQATMPVIAAPMRRVPAAAAAWSMAATLVPLAAVAVVTGILGTATAPADPIGFPAGDALASLSAAAETRRARARLHAATAWLGVAWGAAAGTAAAVLFWPILRENPGGPYLAPYHFVWTGLPVAAVLLAAGAAAWAAVAAREPVVPDPVVAARMTAAHRPLTLVADEPAAAPKASPLVPAARGARMAAALVELAARRLVATAPRLPGLAAGILVAAVVAATVPIFTTGAMTRVLRLEGPTQVNRRPPGAVLFSVFPPSGNSVAPALLDHLQAIAASVGRRSGLPATAPVPYLATPIMPVTAAGDGITMGFLQVDALPDLAAHAAFEQGVPPAAQAEADGTVDAAATDATMENGTWQPYQMGHVYQLQSPGSPPLRVRITGVFAEQNSFGAYWPYDYFNHDVFVDPALLRDLIFVRHVLPLDQATWYTVTDLTTLNADQVPAVMASFAALNRQVTDTGPGARLDASPYPLLSAFTDREQTLGRLLRMASVPVLALAMYFIVLTAGVVVGSEIGEIAVHVSRGAPALLLMALYLVEWVLLAIPLVAAAPFLGSAVARVMGGASGFLRFTARSPLPVIFEGKDLAYAAAVAAIGVLAALLPAASAVGRSIVEARGRASRAVAVPFWQRAYLDVAALGLLAVLWVAFRQAGPQGGGIAAIAGQPGLYLLPCAFLAAAGLVGVRALGFGLRVVDRRAGARLPIAASLSLRQIGRLPAQVAPVMLLLCLATALGTYSAAAARTLEANLTAAVHYRVGADLRLLEVSPCTPAAEPPPVCAQVGVQGTPPRALPPFAANLSAPGVADAAEMIEAPALLTASAQSQGVTLVLVDTAAYGRVAWWPARLEEQPEAAYLALLRSRPDALLVSPAVSGRVPGAAYSVAVGDTPGVTLHKVGTVGHWPGADADGPIAVASLTSAPQLLGFACSLPPDQQNSHYCPGNRIALMRLRPGADVNAIQTFLTKAALSTEQADDTHAEVAAALASPEWAGQNGLFSIGFVVAAAVAATGYLLYALLMLRGQVGQMGLLRAVGLDRRTLIGGVALEQAILVLSGAVVGVLSGIGAAALFVPLYQPAFTGPDAPPFEVLGPGSAVWRLATLLVALFAVVLCVLLWLLVRLRVGESVKLEE